MKKTVKYIFSFLIALSLLTLSLFLFSRLLEPKYVSASKEGNLISEYYKETDKGRKHDVIFIGDCEAYSSFVPPVLYEQYGITSFVRGSPSQSMAQSYHFLCESLRYETPKAIVFSVYAMCKDEKSDEAYNRMTLDGMRLSHDKILSVHESIGEGESVLSYYLPIMRFHTRIYELCDEDASYMLSRPLVSHNGYYMRKERVSRRGEDIHDDLAEHPLCEKNFEYLDKMTEACRAEGVELILVKTPSNSWRYPWYEEWDTEIEEYAESHGIAYYDLIGGASDMSLDIDSDSYDGGMHLNVYGAEKVTKYFGEILKGNHLIKGSLDEKTKEIWEEKICEYHRERNESDR